MAPFLKSEIQLLTFAAQNQNQDLIAKCKSNKILTSVLTAIQNRETLCSYLASTV